MIVRLAIWFALAVSCGSAFAQPAPDWLRGVVWSPPEDDEQAILDLRTMETSGFRAVRVPAGVSEDVLSEADRLGFSVYVDLSAANLPAVRLQERATELERELDTVLQRANRHRSLRHIGLSDRSDTSDPRACEVVGALAETVRSEGPPGMSVYYVTRFPSTDRCVQHADILLVEATDEDPSDVLTNVRAKVSVPVGLAAYGVSVDPEREGGWRMPGSEAHQARHLENTLNRLSSLDDSPAIAFYYRFRDQSAEEGVFSWQDIRRYGLFTKENEPRLAAEVARGMLTGEQTVFAIDAGEERSPGVTAGAGTGTFLMLLSWLVLLGVGLMAAGIPHFETLARHYFGRKDLFREAVQRGSDLGGNATLLFAVLLSIAFGAVVSTVTLSMSHSDALAVFLEGVGPSAQMKLMPILQRPLLMVLLLALGYGLWIVLCQLWLSIVQGRSRRARPTQVLSLVVWARWVWFLLMMLSLLVPTMPARVSIGFSLGLLVVGVLAEFRAGYRIVSDFAAVVRVPAPRLIAVGFVVPALLFVVLGVILLARVGPELGFLWNLATRV